MAIKDRGNITSAMKGSAVNIEDIFSTYVYTGNGTTQDIVNGIDLATDGGMVWLKYREAGDVSHQLFDTERLVGKALLSDTSGTEGNGDLTAFNTDGFSLGLVSGGGNWVDIDYVSWTFKKQPRFFDMVKYTGNGVAGREIAHDLGCDVGMMIVKNISTSYDWFVYHKSLTYVGNLRLNNTGLIEPDSLWVQEPTSTHFSVKNGLPNNNTGDEYIAYLFADDPLGASGDGSDGMIACGSFTTDGSGNATVDLGWEPQYLLVKSSLNSGAYDHDWQVVDMIRGWDLSTATGVGARIKPNTSDAEGNAGLGHPTATGFKYTNQTFVDTYIYMAIRRPMKTPESSDEVFAIDTSNGVAPNFTSGFPIDMSMYRRTSIATGMTVPSRLTGAKILNTSSTAAEVAEIPATFDYMNGWQNSTFTNADYHSWMFKRAKGFFDVVAYTGDGIAGRTVDHNLGVVPEMMWVKMRTLAGYQWRVYHSGCNGGVTPEDFALGLNTTDAQVNDIYWNDTAPTDTVFTVGSYGQVNSNGNNFISYLFATLANISKVGSYTGNGTSQTIDCGFSTGSKFIIIKRTDSTGDWFMWDTTRGIVAANDPHLSLNTTAAEVTTDDSIDPDTSGFIVNQNATTNINVTSATYIYYSIATPL